MESEQHVLYASLDATLVVVYAGLDPKLSLDPHHELDSRMDACRQLLRPGSGTILFFCTCLE